LQRAAAFLAALLFLEAASLAVLWVNDRAFPSPARRARKLGDAIDATGGTSGATPPRSLEAIHPYLGFVYDPAADNPTLQAQHGLPISRFGFLDEHDPVVARRRDRFVIGLFGGSFASWVAQHARNVLVERIARDPRLAGREVVLVNTALGGYKQPQQLLALTYLLSLGGGFDVVVNLDGFNEVVLPVLEHLPKGVFLAYPRNWYLRTADLRTGATLRLVGTAELLRQRRSGWSHAFSLPLLRSSFAAHLLWRLGDRALTRRIGRVEQEVVELAADEHRFVSSGPFEPFPDREAAIAREAALWRDSSLQMDRLARGNGTRYLHFLQPNQYLEGTKPLSDEERARFVDPRSPYATPAREGYLRLQAAGGELQKSGVEFHDLTREFADVQETLYADDCCHVNALGCALVATAIADAILAGPLPGAG
jgi:hypothetical protein